MTTDIIYDLPLQLYLQEKSFSKTDLEHAERSPDYVLKMRDQPDKATVTMNLGSAVHMAILEPERAEKDIVIAECAARRGKVYDQLKEENPNAIILLEKESIDLMKMVESVYVNNTLQEWLSTGSTEVSCFAELEYGGNKIPVKCRPDLLPGATKIIDIKTARDVTPHGFMYASYNYHYHWSAYLSCEILEKITGHPHTYHFIAIENKYPYEVVIYNAGNTVQALAEMELWPVLSKLAMAYQTNYYPKITQENEILELEMPQYAMNKMLYQ